MKVKRGIEPKLDRTATISIHHPDASLSDEEEDSVEPFCSHTELVISSHGELFGQRGHDEIPVKTGGSIEKEAEKVLEEDDTVKLMDNLLLLAEELEIRARRIILDKLEPGSRPRLLLQADTNIMRRTVVRLSKDPDLIPDASSTRPDDLQAIQSVRRR